MERGALFLTLLHLQGDHHCACAQKWRHFSFFPRAFKQKKIKALWPKMTKIASRGSCLKWEIQHLLKSMGFEAGSGLGGVDQKNLHRWALINPAESHQRCWAEVHDPPGMPNFYGWRHGVGRNSFPAYFLRHQMLFLKPWGLSSNFFFVWKLVKNEMFWHKCEKRTLYLQAGHLDAILVIFGCRTLIFVWSKALWQIWKMTPPFGACAVVVTVETQKCRKEAPRFVKFNFSRIAIDTNGFRRTNEEGQIYKR